MARYLTAIDVGGTFTDFVAYDRETGAVEAWKTLSTPDDPTDGVLEGLARIDDLGAVERLRMGTTVATNAILERNGARIAFLATKGFRDTPFIQRGNRRGHYDITWIKPDPLVRRRDCFDITERIDRDGRVVTPLDEDQVRELARELRARGDIEAVAVNFLFSFLDPSHERRVAEIFAAEAPEIPVSISFDVLPRWKEYERASTTIADAYLKPRVGPYLRAMGRRLSDAGLAAHVSVIKSNGGEMTLKAAADKPIHMTVSGPSGGVIGAKTLADLIDEPNVVTLDMGGTSTDCATIIDGAQHFTTSFEVEWGLPVQVPMIDIRTIGAGGGSIAWVDKGGMLRVGPRSAGADPGPACYGRGGAEPTVTDANVALGRISPDNFLGGAMALDRDAAERAVADVGQRIGYAPQDAALAIVHIANVNMVGALRAVLLERGLDPRDFTLFAFGGAGPLHAADLMAETGVRRGLIPVHPGQFSAFGFINSDARVDRHRTVQMNSGVFDAGAATRILGALIADGEQELRDQGFATAPEVATAVEMRYFGQNYELDIPIAFRVFDAETTPRLWRLFHDQHQARFGFNAPGSAIELVNFMATAIAATPKPELPRLASGDGGAATPIARRAVVFAGGALEADVYDRENLRAGDAIAGPALIEEAASVTVVRPDQRASVDEFGDLVITPMEVAS